MKRVLVVMMLIGYGCSSGLAETMGLAPHPTAQERTDKVMAAKKEQDERLAREERERDAYQREHRDEIVAKNSTPIVIAPAPVKKWVRPRTTKTTRSEWLKDDRDFAKDLSDCQAKAGQAAIGVYDPSWEYRSSILDSCLYGHGWTQVD